MDVLEDDALVSIISRVADIRCALVCKRWARLHCFVDRLNFRLLVRSKEDMREMESTIYAVLDRHRSPGCLKELSVQINCHQNLEATCRWLACAGSATAVVLKGDNSLLRWGPKVFTFLSSYQTLRSLEITGSVLSARPDKVSLPELISCKISFTSGFPLELLQKLLVGCPRLEFLTACGAIFPSSELRLSSASLRSLCFSASEPGGVFMDAPNLTSLAIYKTPQLEFHNLSGKILRELTIKECALVLDPQQQEIETLNILGRWDPAVLTDVLLSASEVTNLTLHMKAITKNTKMCIGRLLAPLVNLRTLYIEGFSLSAFKAEDVYTFDELDVHVWLTEDVSIYEATVVRELLRRYLVKNVTVHYDSAAVKNEVKKVNSVWHHLFFRLPLRYPGRVEFTTEQWPLRYYDPK